MFDEEARLEVAFEDARAVVRKAPRRGRAAAYRLYEFLHVEAAGFCEGHRLAHSRHRSGYDYLVAELRVLSVSGFAHELYRAAHLFKVRHGGFEIFFVAACEYRQRRFARAFVASGDGRVEYAEAAFFARGVYFAREARAGGRHVDEQRALLRVGDEAVFAEVGFLDVFRVSDYREDYAAFAGYLSGRIFPYRAFFNERLSLFLRAVVDVDFIPRVEQVARHAAAHDACSYKSEDFFLRHFYHSDFNIFSAFSAPSPRSSTLRYG